LASRNATPRASRCTNSTSAPTRSHSTRAFPNWARSIQQSSRSCWMIRVGRCTWFQITNTYPSGLISLGFDFSVGADERHIINDQIYFSAWESLHLLG
jgi:hypothetical protein